MNEQFLQWLKSSPQSMGRFLRIIEEFIQSQAGPVALPESSGEGPATYTVGGTVDLKSIPIREDEIAELFRGAGEAIVREKAFEFIKGFLSGLQMAGGGL